MNTNLKSIYHKVDLCVVGGGLAGMCAAVAGVLVSGYYQMVYCTMGTDAGLKDSRAIPPK